jgi:hypothetical protein
MTRSATRYDCRSPAAKTFDEQYDWGPGLDPASDKLRFGEIADVPAAEAFDTDALHATQPRGYALVAPVAA